MDSGSPAVEELDRSEQSSAPLSHVGNGVSWLLICAIALSLTILAALNRTEVFTAPILLATLNGAFISFTSLLIALVAGRTYLKTGSYAVLVLGAGMLVMSMAAVAIAFIGGDGSYAVTVFNICLCLSGSATAMGALIASFPESVDRKPARWQPIAAAYGLSVLVVASVLVAALKEWIPLFFVDGRFTVLRQLVLLTAVLQFFAASVLFWFLHRRLRASFLLWYSKGFALMTLGLAGVGLAAEPGTLLGWVGRFSQYLSGVYLFVGTLAVSRERRSWEIPFDQEYREVSQRYQSLFNVCPDAILVHSSGRILFANPAAMALLRAERADRLSGMGILDIVEPACRDDVAERIKHAACAITPIQEFRVLRLDGTTCEVETTGAPIHYEGSPAIQVVLRDISARKQAMLELAAARERTERILESITEGYYVLDRNWRVVELNRSAEKHFGIPAAELVGENIWDVSGAKEGTLFWEKLHEAAVSRKPIQFEVESIMNPGAWGMMYAYPSDRGLEVYFHVVTERKQAELLLRASERKYRALFDNMNETMTVDELLFDDQGRPVDWRTLDANPAYSALTGESRESAIGRLFSEGYGRPQAKELLARFASVVKEGKSIQFEQRFDALNVHVLISAFPLGGARFATLSTDITERKRAERQLRELNQTLERRVDARTAELKERALQLRRLASDLTMSEQRERQRLAMVLHEGLQQALVAAKFRLAVLERGGDVQRASAEIANLIDDAVETSRSLTAELSPPILYQSGLAAGIEWLANWMRNKHGLSVDLLLSDRVGKLAEETTILLFQALRELLFNVVKHACVKAARVELATAPGEIRITVADEGVGFDPNGNCPTQSDSGGLGLFSINERMICFGGRMEIDSAPGKGSRFVLIAPAIQSSAVPPAAAVEHATVAGTALENAHDGAPRNRIRLVLVDDHTVMRQGLAGLLRAEPDIDIVGEASDGKTAIDVVRGVRPNVVIMDIGMPRMDGVQATRIIHQEFPEIQIIGLSMFQEDEQRNAMQQAGAFEYLAKTGPSDVIINTIRKSMEHRLRKPAGSRQAP